MTAPTYPPTYRGQDLVPPSFDDQISLGLVPGVSGINKFGRNPDIDTGSPADVWSHGGLYTFTQQPTTYYISSSSAADTGEIVIQGLGPTGNYVSFVQELDGQTKLAISAYQMYRVFRSYNNQQSALNGDVYIYEDDTVVAGVPQTQSKIRAKIDSAEGQTLMAIYTIPIGMTGILGSMWLSMIRGTIATAATVSFSLKTAAVGGAVLTKHSASAHSYGGEYFHEFAGAAALPGGTDIFVRVDEVSANDTDVSAGFSVKLFTEQ